MRTCTNDTCNRINNNSNDNNNNSTKSLLSQNRYIKLETLNKISENAGFH